MDLEAKRREERMREFVYHMRRYTDSDYVNFLTTYGVKPSAELFRSHGVEPLADVRFVAMTKEQCEAERQRVMNQARSMMNRCEDAAADG